MQTANPTLGTATLYQHEDTARARLSSVDPVKAESLDRFRLFALKNESEREHKGFTWVSGGARL